MDDTLKKQLAEIGARDGAYMSELTEAGTIYRTMGGQEIGTDPTEALPPDDIAVLKAKVAALEAKVP